jgi:hypothetical protein
MPKVQINTTGGEKTEQVAQDTVAPVQKTEIRDALAIALEKIDEDFPVEEEEVHKVKPTRRRFFRGIPKRG